MRPERNVKTLRDIRYARFQHHNTWPKWAITMWAQRAHRFPRSFLTPARVMVLAHMERLREAKKADEARRDAEYETYREREGRRPGKTRPRRS